MCLLTLTCTKDEEKIGAFGVGFYSLFSVTDEPFVTSGGQWMGFYWKDNKDQVGSSMLLARLLADKERH